MTKNGEKIAKNNEKLVNFETVAGNTNISVEDCLFEMMLDTSIKGKKKIYWLSSQFFFGTKKVAAA